jgi:hypothetical protein
MDKVFFFATLSGFLAYLGASCVRRGKVSGRGVTIPRLSKPGLFWVNVLLMFGLSLIASIFALEAFFHL